MTEEFALDYYSFANSLYEKSDVVKMVAAMEGTAKAAKEIASTLADRH